MIDYHPQRYWVTEINTGGLDWHYGYDLAGNVTAIDDTRANHSQTFEYDQLDRLHHANAPGGYEAYYDYDAHGNQQSSNFTYDPSNRFRLATVFGFPVGYDNNGNMTSEPNITYAYGSRNLLDRVTTPDATTDYTYDADSWRLKKETVNGAVTYYVRGADGQLLTEQATTAGGMTTTKNYVYAGGRLLAVSKFTAAQ